VLKSQGTYFLTVDLSPLGLNETDEAFCKRIVTDYKVAAIPVSAFYEQDAVTSVVRFCFAKKDATLDTALERLSDAVHRRRGEDDARPTDRFVAAMSRVRCALAAQARGAHRQFLQLVELHGAGGAGGLHQGNRHQGGLRHLRRQRDAGDAAARGNRATTSSCPPAISCSARSRPRFS
jgi:hypothetical protein